MILENTGCKRRKKGGRGKTGRKPMTNGRDFWQRGVEACQLRPCLISPFSLFPFFPYSYTLFYQRPSLARGKMRLPDLSKWIGNWASRSGRLAGGGIASRTEPVFTTVSMPAQRPQPFGGERQILDALFGKSESGPGAASTIATDHAPASRRKPPTDVGSRKGPAQK